MDTCSSQVFDFQFVPKMVFLKSIDGVLGIRTRGRMMIGADDTAVLCRPPICTQNVTAINFSSKNVILTKFKFFDGTIFGRNRNLAAKSVYFFKKR